MDSGLDAPAAGLGFLLMRVPSRAAIPNLLLSGSPSNIAGFIVPVVVRKAVNGMLRRGARANVRQKGREVVTPFVAHRNTATTIVCVLVVFGVEATALHMLPYAPFRRETHAVRAFNLSKELSPPAPATASEPTSQALAQYRAVLAAFTTALPPRLPAFARNLTKHSQPPEHVAGKIDELSKRHPHTLPQREDV